MKFMVRSQKHRVRFENDETEDVDFSEEKVRVRTARLLGTAHCVALRYAVPSVMGHVSDLVRFRWAIRNALVHACRGT